MLGESPAVLTVDFNVSEKWDAYQTITNNEFVMKDAFKIAEKKEGVNYTFHDFGRIPADSCEKIDYIFVTPQIRVIDEFIPAEAPGQFLSDHNPHVATLEF